MLDLSFDIISLVEYSDMYGFVLRTKSYSIKLSTQIWVACASIFSHFELDAVDMVFMTAPFFSLHHHLVLLFDLFGFTFVKTSKLTWKMKLTTKLKYISFAAYT